MASRLSVLAVLTLVGPNLSAAAATEPGSPSAPCAMPDCGDAQSAGAPFRPLLESTGPVVLGDPEAFRAFWNDFRCTSGSRLAAPRVAFGSEQVLAQQGDGVSAQLEVKNVEKRGDKLVVVARAVGPGSATRPRFVIAIPRTAGPVEVEEIAADGAVTTWTARPWDGALRCAPDASVSMTAPAALGDLVAKAEALRAQPVTSSTRADLEILRRAAADIGVTAAFDEALQGLFPSLYADKALGELIAKAEALHTQPLASGTHAELEKLRVSAASIGVKTAFDRTLQRLFPTLYVAKPGELVIQSPNVFGIVVVNGREIGYPPIVAKDIPAGTAKVEILVEGVVRKMKAARIEEGQRRQIVVE